ncbi:hypothetical protein [Methylobacterium nigriterrae]|uniref:hypothetical protein n=1 Tax=Methylobacterium nigriterrae TaxID=3127512 RepID=UPI003013E9F4
MVAPLTQEAAQILSAIAAKLKRQAKADFKGWHFEAALIVQTVSYDVLVQKTTGHCWRILEGRVLGVG